MTERKYYSARTGKKQSAEVDLELLKRLFNSLFRDFSNKGYFQETLGYECVDEGDVAGSIGPDIDLYFLRKLRKENLWPIYLYYKYYDEDDIFDVIELLFDLVSEPIDGYHHNYNNCGWHFNKFNKTSGQATYCKEINEILKDYRDGYELNNKGEITSLGDKRLNKLFEARVPTYDPDNVENRIDLAVSKFRSRHSSRQDRKEAVRELADVLEFLRPKIKQVMMKKDEKDLFNIANSFGIRHHTEEQKTEYDINFLTWIFYAYLSTIHLCLRLIKKEK